MIKWSHSVPEEARKKSYTLKRCPTAGKLTGIVTVENLCGCYTHWYGGKTIPCQAPYCEPCKTGTPKRWHSYLAAWNAKTGEEFLFECTGQGAEYFESYRALTGTLKGCHFTAERLGTKKNGRVVITCRPANLNGLALPDPLMVPEVLSVIWQIPSTAVDPPVKGLKRGTLRVDANIVDSMNNPKSAEEVLRELRA